jgi:hypothetical protein
MRDATLTTFAGGLGRRCTTTWCTARFLANAASALSLADAVGSGAVAVTSAEALG